MAATRENWAINILQVAGRCLPEGTVRVERSLCTDDLSLHYTYNGIHVQKDLDSAQLASGFGGAHIISVCDDLKANYWREIHMRQARAIQQVQLSDSERIALARMMQPIEEIKAEPNKEEIIQSSEQSDWREACITAIALLLLFAMLVLLI